VWTTWTVVAKSYALIAKSHAGKDLLTVITAAPKMVHLVALELVLDTLAVGSVADKWKNRANSLHEEGALGRFGVIQCGL
jgi:hypothetical protein